MPKLVVSRTLAQASEWQNSETLRGDLADEVSAQPVGAAVRMICSQAAGG